ncbi:hypothetical protein Ciccas_002098 [Cichlidogyrus casuarinus]|uniref:Uncharacterized protein n=1 Tax=Cichlidogyrus casuarinus TaxID=1844966 RepID=A0ABD2QI57_9PLAT
MQIKQPIDMLKELDLLRTSPLKDQVIFNPGDETLEIKNGDSSTFLINLAKLENSRLPGINTTNLQNMTEIVLQILKTAPKTPHREVAIFFLAYKMHSSDDFNRNIFKAIIHFVLNNSKSLSLFGIWSVTLLLKWTLEAKDTKDLLSQKEVSTLLRLFVDAVSTDEQYLLIQVNILYIIKIMIMKSHSSRISSQELTSILNMEELAKYSENCSLSRNKNIRLLGFYALIIRSLEKNEDDRFRQIIRRHVLFDKRNPDMLRNFSGMQNLIQTVSRNSNQETFRKLFLSWCWFKINCAFQTTEHDIEGLVIAQMNQVDLLYSRTLLQTLKMFITPEENVVNNLLRDLEKIISDQMFPQTDKPYLDVDEEFLNFIDQQYSQVPNSSAWRSVYSLPVND